MTDNSLRQKKDKNYKDKIIELVNSNPGQMSFEEYEYIYNLIERREGCNLLIFGLGRDSELWLDVNKNGKTIFLEDNQEWITIIKNQMYNLGVEIDIRHITYEDVGHDANKLLNEYKSGENKLALNLFKDIRETKWDMIIVDAPPGYAMGMPCRMKSIYESYHLSNNRSKVDIIVHDAERTIETLYTEYFFKDYDHLKTIDDGKHGVLQHYVSN